MERSQRIESRSFSRAFEQICEIVAISEVRDRKETLRRLISHCFSELSGEGLGTGHEVAKSLDELYGLSVPSAIAQEALDELIRRGDLVRDSELASWRLRPDLSAQLGAKIAAAASLELRVKERWVGEVSREAPNLAGEQLWCALQAYLFRAFRRHGIQAASLLDPTIDVAPEYSENLSTLLDEAVGEAFDAEEAVVVKKIISSFLATVGSDRERSSYIAQLGDGAFSYFSLTVSPEVASVVRGQLRPLKLFLDTNFIFGVIGLGEHVWSDLSEELVELARQDTFPFDLLYHSRTDREVNGTIQHYESYLASKVWTDGLARAAVKAEQVGGVVRQYLQAYLQTAVDARTFFRPFQHVDELLRSRGIQLYNESEERQEARATLLAEYREFLEGRGREKRYKVIEHDATLLDTVRCLRNTSSSSMEAGALLLTYDYNLYRFEWESSRRGGMRPCAVLPNIFWQILRPFVPPDERFDKSFAETFALPEFRTIGSDSAAASQRMLGILASYDSIPEETATRLLSNDLLLERLRGLRDDDQFERAVECALVEENKALISEREDLRAGVEEAKSAIRALGARLEEERIRREETEVLAREAQGQLADAVSKEDLARVRSELDRASSEAQQAQEGRVTAEAESRALKRRIERERDWIAVIGSLGVGVALAFGMSQMDWIVAHPRFRAMQLLGGLGAAFFFGGLLRPKTRPIVWWGSGGLTILVIVLASLL